jgi:hypothetical protein
LCERLSNRHPELRGRKGSFDNGFADQGALFLSFTSQPFAEAHLFCRDLFVYLLFTGTKGLKPRLSHLIPTFRKHTETVAASIDEAKVAFPE